MMISLLVWLSCWMTGIGGRIVWWMRVIVCRVVFGIVRSELVIIV